jgi:hypothetical protein
MDATRFNTEMDICNAWHQAKIGPDGLGASTVDSIVASIDRDGTRSPGELEAASHILEYSMPDSDERARAEELCEKLGLPVEDHGFLSFFGDLADKIVSSR